MIDDLLGILRRGPTDRATDPQGEGESSRVRVAHSTRTGDRSDNEDAATGSVSKDGRRGVVAVADGMGGHAGGRIASRAALDLAALNLGTEEGRGRVPDDLEDLQSWLRELCRQSNRSVVRALESNDAEDGGTTLAVSVATPSALGVLNVGDTRVYRLKEGLERVSEDHTAIAERRKEGASYGELVHSPYRHALSRALGQDSSPEPSVTVCERSGSTGVLICTDGVHGPLTRGEIARVIRTTEGGIQRAAEALTETAVAKDGSDNATAALLSVS